jgi:FtsH-binding integral membrane protein
MLKIALVVFGATCCLLYPLTWIWPSGWQWHGGEGVYYFQMIAGIYIVLGLCLINAARDPSKHISLIWFAILSSIVHAGIMGVQAMGDHHERGHLIGDVPALLLMAVVLWALLPRRTSQS